MPLVSVIRIAQFNSAHRLHRNDWDEKKNREVFGLCSLPNYHGHNYKLEVKVTGEVDLETGYVIDLGLIKKLIEEEVMDSFDHRNLNLDTVEFKNLNPTAENIAVVIYNKLKNRLPKHLQLNIRLHETERNVVEYNGN